MSSIPNFKVSSKPQLSAQEFKAEKDDTSKYLQEPGTYGMTITVVKFGNISQYDSAWIQADLTLADVKGRTLRMFLDVPVECRNSFLFGEKKTTYNYENLQKFFRGLGLVLDFDNTMNQVSALFGNPDQLIGKPLNVRLGYKGVHVKYIAKDEYSVVEKDHETLKIEGVFANKAAAETAAVEAGVKGITKNSGYMNVLEIFPGKEPVIDLDAPVSESVDLDLPF